MRIKFIPRPSQSFFIKFTAAVLVFILSILVLPFYINGDQIGYRRVYALLPELGIVEGYAVYFSQVDSLEFVHFILSWLASRFIEKDLFISFFNAILAYATMSLFQKWKASIVISFFLVLTNYYFIVLYLSAERLKFGFIFLALSVMYIQQVKLVYGLAVLALIAHAQVLIVYISILLNAFTKVILRIYCTGRMSKSLLFSVFLLLPPILVGEQLINKFYVYSNVNGLAELPRALLFLLLALWYSKKKAETILMFIPIIFAVLLVGGDRINIFAYFIFLYYGFQSRRGWNLGVLATSLYYSYTSISLLTKVFMYGDGFFSG